jgi:hypothetical protein
MKALATKNDNVATARIDAQDAIDARSELYDHPETGLQSQFQQAKAPVAANSAAATANTGRWRGYGTDERGLAERQLDWLSFRPVDHDLTRTDKYKRLR